MGIVIDNTLSSHMSFVLFLVGNFNVLFEANLKPKIWFPLLYNTEIDNLLDSLHTYVNSFDLHRNNFTLCIAYSSKLKF